MKKLIYIIILLCFIAGCGPLIVNIVKMRPIKINSEYDINNVDDTVTFGQKDVQVSLTYQNIKRLKGYGENPSINPFCTENKELYTVYSIIIKNNRKEKIYFDPYKCVILDGMGNQLNSLSLDYIEKMYPNTSTAPTYSYSYFYNEYVPTYSNAADYYKRRIAVKNMIKPGDIYPGVKSEGLLVFEKVKQEAVESPLILVIPDIVLYDNDKETEKINFKFSFLQEIRVIKE